MDDAISQWKFAQCFGEKEELETVAEADIITTLAFDSTGNYLATGDKGGRAVLFQKDNSKRNCEYHFFAEFQSHEPEFDYLKSLEIEEKINNIKWCKKNTQAHHLLSTNDKTIKLWKVCEKSVYSVVNNNYINSKSSRQSSSASTYMDTGPCNSIPQLQLPKVASKEDIMLAMPKRVYSSAHTYHINSISINSDGETFLSADDLRINLWSLSNEKSCFNVVDLKPISMENLSEVISVAEFHPSHCHQFLYGTSKGIVKVCDLRISALCDQYAQAYEDKSMQSKSFFTEIISTIQDVKYSPDGRFILSRDYMYLKLWDMTMNSSPLLTIPVHEHLRPKLCELYENDAIFDKFSCGFNGSGTYMISGSYNNLLYIFDTVTGKRVNYVHADKSVFNELNKLLLPLPVNNKSKLMSFNKKKKNTNEKAHDSIIPGINDHLETNKRITNAVWHPIEDILAIPATNNLFIFTA